MELSSSSLLSFHLPFPLHSSSSLSFLSLALPPTGRRSRSRAASLIARAELPDSGDGSSSTDGMKPAGFGGVAEPKRKKKKGKEGTVIRRSPIERPSLYSAGREEGRPSEGEQSANESAFLLTWLGLGLLILVEGIALAASGFLPEEWDSFFVKYLYPSFTPTVFLFVGGTVVYGVFKYLQGENMKS